MVLPNTKGILPECCLSIAITISLIICLAWYLCTKLCTKPANVIGFWGTLDGKTYEISAANYQDNLPHSIWENLIIKGPDGIEKGNISPFRTVSIGKRKGLLMADDRILYWYNDDEWFKQGV